MNDDLDRLKYALALALQFVPLQSRDPKVQVDIDLIADLIAGRAIVPSNIPELRRNAHSNETK